MPLLTGPRRALLYAEEEAAGGGQVEVGSFQEPSSTGDQAISTLGFKPQVILCIGSAVSTLGSAVNHHVNSIGMACRSTSETIYQSGQSWSFEHGAAIGAADSRAGLTATYCFYTFYWDGTNRSRGKIKSFDNNGFTITWDTISGNNEYFGYLAFRSSDIAERFIKQYLSRGSVGTLGITGVGFQPENILLNLGGGIYNSTTGTRTTMYASVGFEAGSGGHWSVSECNNHQVSPWGPRGNSRNSTWSFACMASPTPAPGTRALINCNTLDSDGFTINETISPGYAYGYHALCLDGGPANIKGAVWSTGGGFPSTWQVTGVGFQPDFVIFGGHYGARDIHWNGQGQMGLGFMDANGNQFATNAAGSNGIGPSVGSRIAHTNRCFQIMSPAGVSQQAFSFKSMDEDGFTLNCYITTATSSAPFYYAAVKVAD